MTTKRSVVPRRPSSNEPTAPSPPRREPVIGPSRADAVVARASSPAEPVADPSTAESSHTPSAGPTDAVASKAAAAGTAVRIGVPLPEDVTVGFSAEPDRDVTRQFSGGADATLAAVRRRRAEQLDAFEQQAAAGASDAGPNQGVDKRAIASGDDRIVERTESIRYGSGGQQQTYGSREYFSPGSDAPYYTQRWDFGDGGSYYGERDAAGSGFDLNEDGSYVEIDGSGDGDVFRHDDGRVTVWRSGSPPVTYHPNGDVELEVNGDREVHHRDGSSHVYKQNGQIIYSPPPTQGTGGGEGEGEAPAPQDQTPAQQHEQQDDQQEEDDSDHGSAGQHDGQDDGAAGEQEEGDDDGAESSSRPIDPVDPGVRAVIEAGRAFGFHPGAATAHRLRGGGDVDPADPAVDHTVAAAAEPLVDLKQRLLVGPSEPELVGGRGSGTIPGSPRADSGVIDPSDDAASGPGGIGPEDDPFAGVQPGLEPEAPDGDHDDDPVISAIDGSVRAVRDLGIVSRQPSSMVDLDAFDS